MTHSPAVPRLAAVPVQAAAYRAWHPEWWLVAVVGLAWSGLLAWSGTGPNHGVTRPGHWVLMSVAMMLPLALPAARHVGLNSLRSRRGRAVGLCAAGFLVVVIAFGAPALGLAAALGGLGIGPPTLVPIALAVAAGWQLTRWKRRAVLRCRSGVALPPVGRRADAAAVRSGIVQGRRCLVSCWPSMLLMALAGHVTVGVMALLAAGLLAEERTRRPEPVLRAQAVAFAAAAVIVAVVG